VYGDATLYFSTLILIASLAQLSKRAGEREPRKMKRESAWFNERFFFKINECGEWKKKKESSQGFTPSIVIKKKAYVERPKSYIKRNHSYTQAHASYV
jgi:hypothetical protein